MQTRTFAGGWYADCLPSGRYVVLIEGSHLETDAGKVSFLKGATPTTFQPLFPRLSDDGLTFAGQSHDDPSTVEYLFAPMTWAKVNQAAIGVSPVIYDKANVLHISDGSVGSQGWRYVAEDGTLVTGDATYAPGPGFNLFEWTDLSRGGDTLIIGQGPESGCHIWDGTAHRELATGECRFIRAHRVGDSVSVAIWRPGQPTLLVWATVAELLALPIVAPPPVVVDHFGPVSSALPDGTEVAVADFAFAPVDWTRTGTHDMQQVTRPEGVYFVKFHEPTAYELWVRTSWGIEHLEDASAFDSGQTQIFTQTRWFPDKMRVGPQYGYVAPSHEAVWYDRVTKQEVNRVGFERTMWLLAAWDVYDFGPDLPQGPCRCAVYDATGGVYSDPGETDPSKIRGIELFYFGTSGWVRWEYHHSGRVYQGGAPYFDDYTRLARSDFYRTGGTSVTVQPTGLATTPTPEVPPVTETPMPDAVIAALRRFAMAYPPPWGPPGETQDQNCRDWTWRLAEYVCFVAGPAWGAKSTSNGGPSSKDVIAHDGGSQLDGYDVLTAAGSGQPTVPETPGWIDITGQHFIPVSPVNHLNGAGEVTGRPPLTLADAIGLTSFDLSLALETSDAWLQYCKAEGITAPRVILARQPTAMTLDIAYSRVPHLLSKLAFYGMQAEIVLLADTAKYGLTEADALKWVADCIALMEMQPEGVGTVQGANEPEHSTQQPFIRNAVFMAQVQALVPKVWPYSHGSSTNGSESVGASYLTTHGDRSRSAYDNALVSLQLSKDTGKPVKKDEPIGVAEVAIPGSRTNDPDYGRQFADAIRINGLPGGTLHIQAGLTCDVNALGPIQRDAVKRFVARMKEGTVPPPVLHPILDADMTNDAVWYPIFVGQGPAIDKISVDWYVKAHGGQQPAYSDIRHGQLWRGTAERMRWGTLRNALENTWPGGAP